MDFDWQLLKYILIPLISAFIGWMTNWVAVKMLFHPKKPVNLGFFVLQGIFHRRQKDIAHKLSETIEKKLFSSHDIKETLKSNDFSASILPAIQECLDEFVDQRLKNIHPMMSMLPDSLINMFKTLLLDEFEKYMPRIMESAGDNLDKHLNIKETIKNKIESFEVEQLEDILFSILKSEFKMIEYIGGVIGFFIGITQLIIIQFF